MQKKYTAKHRAALVGKNLLIFVERSKAMAEYIDRQKIILCRFYDGADYNQAMKCINRVPTADVVERSKIDEAIEETYKVREEVVHSNTTYEPNDVLEIIDEITAYFEEL
jgi:hypothetical protein